MPRSAMPDRWTRVSGEGRADDINARIGYVNKDGQVNHDWNHRDNDNRENRFRPAAAIE